MEPKSKKTVAFVAKRFAKVGEPPLFTQVGGAGGRTMFILSSAADLKQIKEELDAIVCFIEEGELGLLAEVSEISREAGLPLSKFFYMICASRLEPPPEYLRVMGESSGPIIISECGGQETFDLLARQFLATGETGFEE